jgi:hypothetical protein
MLSLPSLSVSAFPSFFPFLLLPSFFFFFFIFFFFLVQLRTKLQRL